MIEQVHETIKAIEDQVSKVVVGQAEMLEVLLMALLARGHVLLEGVPGTGKTLMTKSLATTIQCQFRRVQMTPDLMPSDVVGTSVYDQRTGNFGVLKGPVFTNILLADEVNRAPAKTQSALLECMGEKQVTIEGRRFALPGLFLVLATQNPVEQEGTYPLPEAQLDRFMFKIQSPYPSEADEARILENMEKGFDPQSESTLVPVTKEADLLQAQEYVRSISMREDVRLYVTRLVRATRDHAHIALGAGPRGTVDLYLASKAAAVMAGRDFVTPDDVKKVSKAVLRHRLFLKPQADLEGRTTDQVLTEILSRAKVPR
jgi:MoxR-like ATPase